MYTAASENGPIADAPDTTGYLGGPYYKIYWPEQNEPWQPLPMKK
jgi:hypothetical protein